MFKSPETGVWEGPATVKLIGRGYMCLLTGKGIGWIPAKWVKPYLKPLSSTHAVSRGGESVKAPIPDSPKSASPTPDS